MDSAKEENIPPFARTPSSQSRVLTTAVRLGVRPFAGRIKGRSATIRLWRSLLGFTGDPELAKDAMAEAFTQALGRGDAIRHQDRWVWRAAFRIASGEMKQRSHRRPLEDDRSYEMPEPPTDLLRVLQQLSPRQRAVIILHFYAGHSTR